LRTNSYSTTEFCRNKIYTDQQMDTGNFIHILITVVGIIGAAAVALVCDMLKTNNERLRQANLELEVRREEEQRRTELALDQLKRLTVTVGEAGRALPAARSVASQQPAMAALASAAPETRGTTMPEARMVAREFLENLSNHRPLAHDAPPAPEPLHMEAPVASVAASEPAALRTPRKNWDLLLKGAAHRTTIDVTPVPAARQRGELIPFESLQLNAPHTEAERFKLPAGFHGIGELNRLLEMAKAFDGLVVSVAMNNVGADPGNGIPVGTLRGAVAEWVRGILRTSEFACQSAIDQLIIIVGGEPEATQDRLREITGKLWDFQLRDEVTSDTVLSWGSYESHGQTLSEAVRTAVQRMEENRRSRVAASSGSASSRRRAV
jgi:hypothetical protein